MTLQQEAADTQLTAASCCRQLCVVTPVGVASIDGKLAALQISARAVFSKYSITPARALNFGPVLYNTSAGARTLEVTNVGEVPVSLRLFDPAKGLVSSPLRSASYVYLLHVVCSSL